MWTITNTRTAAAPQTLSLVELNAIAGGGSALAGLGSGPVTNPIKQTPPEAPKSLNDSLSHGISMPSTSVF